MSYQRTVKCMLMILNFSFIIIMLIRINIIRSSSDIEKTQTDLNKLMTWSQLWLLKFNVSKCKRMHIGSKNTRHIYTMYDSVLNRFEQPETKIEKDLGIMISNDLKWSTQVSYASGKANKMLGIIKHSFKNLDINAPKLLYTSLVRPHLDYANSVWCPYLEQDFKKLNRYNVKQHK